MPQPQPQWNSTLLRGDVPEAVATLKATDQTLMIAGSAQLVKALRGPRLIDGCRLMIFPVVVGRGKRLFGDSHRQGTLDLIGSRTTRSGVVLLTYRPAS